METVKFLILGAGPSGLALAHGLLERGVPADEVLVLERESVAGGLCRSEEVDGAPLDIGGGHFLDVRKKEVLELLFRFLPEAEWEPFDRISKIRLRGQEIDYPLEANLWQLAKDDQVDFLESIARAGCVSGTPMPAAFGEWITWKLGERIANEYMLPYNRKIWSIDLDALGTYWLYKLPDVSFRDTLRSCLTGKPEGTLPAHARFLYPRRYGYGEVWRRMGEALGDRLLTGCPVESIDLPTRTVNDRWRAETIASTIPWTIWPSLCSLPAEVVRAISRLRHSAVDVDYVAEAPGSDAHWIYDPDESVSHHRRLLRANFARGSKGYWTETNSLRAGPPRGFRHRNEFAYPVNTLDKPELVKSILQWAAGHGIVGLGRWGRWEHMNSDVAVTESLEVARQLTRKGATP